MTEAEELVIEHGFFIKQLQGFAYVLRRRLAEGAQDDCGKIPRSKGDKETAACLHAVTEG